MGWIMTLGMQGGSYVSRQVKKHWQNCKVYLDTLIRKTAGRLYSLPLHFLAA